MKQLPSGVMIGVREHSEGYPVELLYNDEAGRWVVQATNEGGHRVTTIDFEDLVQWIAKLPLPITSVER